MIKQNWVWKVLVEVIILLYCPQPTAFVQYSKLQLLVTSFRLFLQPVISHLRLITKRDGSGGVSLPDVCLSVCLWAPHYRSVKPHKAQKKINGSPRITFTVQVLPLRNQRLISRRAYKFIFMKQTSRSVTDSWRTTATTTAATTMTTMRDSGGRGKRTLRVRFSSTCLRSCECKNDDLPGAAVFCCQGCKTSDTKVKKGSPDPPLSKHCEAPNEPISMFLVSMNR